MENFNLPSYIYPKETIKNHMQDIRCLIWELIEIPLEGNQLYRVPRKEL
jgi:hypothetical protein